MITEDPDGVSCQRGSIFFKYIFYLFIFFNVKVITRRDLSPGEVDPLLLQYQCSNYEGNYVTFDIFMHVKKILKRVLCKHFTAQRAGN